MLYVIRTTPKTVFEWPIPAKSVDRTALSGALLGTALETDNGGGIELMSRVPERVQDYIENQGKE
ncbi:MAG: hypothetical protein NTAFB09_25480 [Nitrosospira sp.]